ncbi:Protein CBG19845 [Caenorhabditis briggsae]|uniref:Protein CBG19845 n=1 Tax=Caenorhabditis briggsae TaxID=6238 RepID=A8XWK7_CAEBR|nr:Protein CBG19845 [Caenorhabditis briggsae]CAP37026.2 Protein CBG19845 [Caenorhabditis briggsae]
MWKVFLLFILLLKFGDASGNCDAKNYQSVGNAPNNALIYGITQDCQMFFIRPSQLHLLSTIRVDKRHSFCYANLVQLHVKAHDTLLLTFKQASNRICTLEVHIPALNMLFGDHLFRYSLLNSLPYASCSYSKDQTFQLEPDLSFMDPVYNDVIYFIDALSSGKQWKVLQFLLKDTGTMSMMNNLTVSLQTSKLCCLMNFDYILTLGDSSANEFVASLDNQRDKLYRRNRFDNLIYQQCAFEMMFRPKETEVSSFETPARGYGAVLNGQSVDGDFMVYVETDRTTDPPTTRLNMLSTSHPEHVSCVSATSFSYDVGIIREATVTKLKSEPRPPFGTKVSPRPSSKAEKLNDQASKRNRNSTPSPTASEKKKPTSPSSSSTSTPSEPPPNVPTSVKPKGTYSPSKSFFSYEFGGAGTTASAPEVISNEIPVKEIAAEQVRDEEELNEIIKELKSDEEKGEEEDSEDSGEDVGKEENDVGEMKTREVNITTEKGGDSSESSNATSSDAEAVKSSRISMNSNLIVLFISAISIFNYFN